MTEDLKKKFTETEEFARKASSKISTTVSGVNSAIERMEKIKYSLKLEKIKAL